MKKIFLFIILLASMKFYGQNLLSPEWKFKIGDNLQWAQPDIKDTDWDNIKTGEKWENLGYTDYDGFAWYRKTIIIPKSLKEQAEKYGGLSLYLSMIDDADQTFFNGELLGETGQMPPNYVCAYNAERSYLVPPGKIRFDQPNVIAVRVYDDGGGGGIYGGECSLKVKGVEDFVNIDFNFQHHDRIIREDDKMIALSAKITNESDQTIDGVVKVEIITDKSESVYSKEDRTKLKPSSSINFDYDPKNIQPGFYSFLVSFESQAANKTSKTFFGVKPEQIISPTDRAEDFEEYWSEAKKELSEVDPQFKLIRQDSLCTAEREAFLVEMRSLGNVLVRGWYVRPVEPGVYPAILHVQGYGSTMTIESTYQGNDMIALALNIRGHGNSKDDVDPGEYYILHNIENKDEYIYRGAYMDCIRAMDFLWSQPEVDTTKIIVEGGSQGGALSFATAALDNERIALCVPHIPFLSDFKDYFEIAIWPGEEVKNYVKNNPDSNWETIYNTLSYIDIKNLAPLVKAPVFMGVGLMDDVCPPHINFAAYNNLNVEREYVVYPESDHHISPDFHDLKYKWIKEKLEKM